MTSPLPATASSHQEPAISQPRRTVGVLAPRLVAYVIDLFIVGLEGHELHVHYQGACGSCPSSLSGTLAGIESLVHQIDPTLEVVPV